MKTQLLAGSLPLQLAFVTIAVFLVALVSLGLGRASAACGDAPWQRQRLVRRFHIVAALWLGAVSAAAATGLLARWDRWPPLFLFVAAGIVVLGVLCAQSEVGDRLARGLPLAALVAVQGFRLPLELVMHRAYTEGLMPVQMSYSGRNLDIVTGATAIVLAAVMIWTRVPAWVVRLWNVMGLALLANIVGIALLSTPQFQYFGPDRLNTFVTRLPYVYLPTVMVLVAWAGHLVIFKALRVRDDGALP